MRFVTLDEWLSWQETLHPTDIELGLERVATVFQQLHVETPPFPVITVAGTNGKGSTAAVVGDVHVGAVFVLSNLAVRRTQGDILPGGGGQAEGAQADGAQMEQVVHA